ncbi:MAG: hypothetical protein GY694_15690 [Gammaproteobacteria bacterium]|nr:hypothetical protein [Gammaproteobacteria bacterium]
MRIILLLISLFLMGCEFSNKEPLTLTSEQAVYESVALKYINSMSKEIKVLNKTNGIWFQRHSLNELKERATWEEYGKTIEFKAPEHLLEKLFSLNQEIEEINWSPIIVNGQMEPAENHAPFKSGPRNEITSSYYSFSKIAFSSDEKHALVKFTHHCPVLCGGEWIIYLNLVDQKWNIVDAVALWVS